MTTRNVLILAAAIIIAAIIIVVAQPSAEERKAELCEGSGGIWFEDEGSCFKP